MRLRADLHIHTVLSPCGSLEMSPADIVKAALLKNLDIIAVSDHNCAKNLRAFAEAAKGKIDILYGLEIQALSETHMLVLFDNLENAEKFDEIIYTYLPEIINDPEYFGDQVIVDSNDSILGFEEKLLIQSVEMEEDEIIDEAHSLNGLVFYSHIDRDSFSVISQLGFIPPDTKADGAEISSMMTLAEARLRYPEYKKIPFITNSDAHYIKDVGKVSTIFEIESVSVEEIRKALQGKDGRRIVYDA